MISILFQYLFSFLKDPLVNPNNRWACPVECTHAVLAVACCKNNHTSQARTVTTEWHAEFNLPVRIIEPERETVMSYDANGRLLSRTVNERGL